MPAPGAQVVRPSLGALPTRACSATGRRRAKRSYRPGSRCRPAPASPRAPDALRTTAARSGPARDPCLAPQHRQRAQRVELCDDEVRLEFLRGLMHFRRDRAGAEHLPERVDGSVVIHDPAVRILLADLLELASLDLLRLDPPAHRPLSTRSPYSLTPSCRISSCSGQLRREFLLGDDQDAVPAPAGALLRLGVDSLWLVTAEVAAQLMA